jgi:hypothetical protein
MLAGSSYMPLSSVSSEPYKMHAMGPCNPRFDCFVRAGDS